MHEYKYVEAIFTCDCAAVNIDSDVTNIGSLWHGDQRIGLLHNRSRVELLAVQDSLSPSSIRGQPIYNQY